MANIFDCPAGDLIETVAEELKKNPSFQAPTFTAFVKTGPHRERAPQDKDWWFLRVASILYRTYKNGPVGTGRLRSYYGGRQARGVKPHHFRKSGGKIIRVALQRLEQNGFIKKIKKGRVITAEGEKLLAAKAKETLAGLEEKRKQKALAKLERLRLRRERESKEKVVVDHKQKEDKSKKAKPMAPKKEKE